MKIALIVYSLTGNTLSVAEKLRQSLLSRGHTAEILRIEGENDQPGGKQPPKLKTAPDPAGFDAFVFASPVQAFSLAPVMKLYLAQMPAQKGKKAHCFVTQHLKKAWMGGNNALRQMKGLCKEKGISVLKTGDVHWSAPERDAQTDALVESLLIL